MSIVILDQEVQRLFQIPKTLPLTFKMPTENETSTSFLVVDGQEQFQLNIERRNTLEVFKSKTQGAYFREPILRIEVDAPPHTNPDFTEIGRNHIHIYREGYRMRWAYSLETFHEIYFKQPFNFPILFDDFCKFFNIQIDSNMQEVISCIKT